MTEARTIPATDDSSRSEALARTSPAVERWLRWSGLVPLPALLLVHLTLELRRAFPRDLSDVVRGAPDLLASLASVLLVWLPLGLHLVLAGWLLATGRRPRQLEDDLPVPWRQVSRSAGVLAGVFLLYHARRYPFAVWLSESDARDAGFRLIEELSSTHFGVPLSGAGYLLGLLATSTHAGIGLQRAMLAEGWLRDARRRRLSAGSCAVFAVLSFCVGAAAVIRVASGVLLR